MKVSDLRDHEFRVLDVTTDRMVLEDADGSLIEINAVASSSGDGTGEFEFFELKAKSFANG
jgi:hypothetical protein